MNVTGLVANSGTVVCTIVGATHRHQGFSVLLSNLHEVRLAVGLDYRTWLWFESSRGGARLFGMRVAATLHYRIATAI